MIVSIEHETKDYRPCWPDLSCFFKQFQMNAYDHHNLMIAEMNGLLVLAGDAKQRHAEFAPVWGNDFVDMLFTADQDMQKAAKPFLDQKGIPRVNMVFVDILKIDDECRGMGYGTELLRKLADYQHIAPVVFLRASPLLIELEDIPRRQHGAVKENLHQWYKNMGFNQTGKETFTIATRKLGQLLTFAERQQKGLNSQSPARGATQTPAGPFATCGG
jgi:GNAT superfamily N-acetyltransferase